MILLVTATIKNQGMHPFNSHFIVRKDDAVMSEINISYNEVYARTAQMRREIATTLNEMDSEYRRIQHSLNDVDGSTAVRVREAVNENRRKTCEVAATLDKLVSFMSNSARQMEAEELKIANVFTSSRVMPAQRTAT